MKFNGTSQLSVTALLILFILVLSCKSKDENTKEVSLKVTASAYNSILGQTQGSNPSLTAWGDTLVPGERAIAVSRDLIKRGLTHGTEVKIEGLSGTYIVKDKMHHRWQNKIDIYMGLDKEAALEWGRQKVEITFHTEVDVADRETK